MHTFRPWLGALAALAFATASEATEFSLLLKAEASRPPAPHLVRSAFLQRPAIEEATLSPDGDHVAFLRRHGEDRGLWLLEAATGVERALLARSDATRLAWTHDGRWLLVISPDKVFALAMDRSLGAHVLTSLGGTQRREFVDVDPSMPASIVVRERLRDALGQPADWRLSRVDIDSREEVLDTDRDRVEGYVFARNGRLAYVQHLRDDALVTTHIEADGRRSDILRCGVLRRCALWPSLDKDAQARIVMDSDGMPSRLRRMDTDGTTVDLAGDPRHEGDIEAIVADPDDGMPALLDYRAARATAQALDESTAARLATIRRILPDAALSIDIGRSRWLVRERNGDVQGTRFHLLNVADESLRDILTDKPMTARGDAPGERLPTVALARQLPFAWTASDGMRLHGFVRVPPGRDARQVPLVVLVHGGPWANVAAGDFGSGLAAFLANRGYAVFEPNYRGSTGFGTRYMLAPEGDFGNGRVQRDIVEGTRALLAEGVGDGNKVAIAGASFGGYSTLLGLTWQPDLFKLGVAVVPPTDFAWDIAWLGRTPEAESLSRKLPYERWMAALSLDPADGTAMTTLHAQSPLVNARRMSRPVLIVAGGQDQRVALRGVLGYAATLRRLDRSLSLLVDPAEGHSSDAPLVREATFHAMAVMFHRYLGGDADDVPDTALNDYLRRNMRLDANAIVARGDDSTRR